MQLRMWLKTYLTLTGIGAFLALAFPWLVIMGMFMMAIPGLILGMMPTAFLYGLVFAAIRFVLVTMLSGAALNIAAAALTFAVFWAIPQPAKLAANAELEALRQEQVLPTSRVELAGNILVRRPFESRCDDLCAALLKTSGVTSVTLQSKRGEPVTYTIADDTTEGEAGKIIGYGLLEPGMAAAERRTRDELVAALDDPSRPGSDPAFSLANQWMESHRASDGPLSNEDRALLSQVIADPRITDPSGLWAAVGRLEGDAADLRRLAALRYLAAEDKKAARGWIKAFGSLPAGAFATIVPEKQQILSSVKESLYATSLVRRQGDRGVEAVPDLLRLLRGFASHDPGRHGYGDVTSATGAVRKAFRIIGPEASFAREDIEAVLAMESMDHRYKRVARTDWDELLYVLGKPLYEIEKPDNRSGTAKNYRDWIVLRTSKPVDPTRD